MLVPNDALRIWDIALIYGFEIFHKFGLILLSQNEGFIINSLKYETKALDLGASVDSLIISGNITMNKLLRRVNKFVIERLVKKMLKKPSYSKIRRTEYIFKAELIERNNNYRLVRICQTKQILKASGFSLEIVKKIINALLDNEYTPKHISRASFISSFKSVLNWPLARILNLFNTLDYTFNDSLTIGEFSSFLPLFLPTLEERLQYGFISINREKISIKEFVKTLNSIEIFFDPRSKAYQTARNAIYNFLKIEVGEYIDAANVIEIFTNSPLFKPILDYLQILDHDEIKPNELRVAEIQIDGKFSNIHSPISMAFIPGNENKNQAVNFKEVEDKLTKLLLGNNGIQDIKTVQDVQDVRENVINDSIEEDGSEKNRRQSEDIKLFTEPIRNNEVFLHPINFPEANCVKINRSCSRYCSGGCLIF